ncbi:50S ribosomal protein L9 [Candidatus Uhrbacteria bacterium CG10_big_fil_rev_8_21_14_0_10_48_16]|uniref:Large ribosomal subunit protein bL9 n=1 Tax=Candidatus Uhrbacteria bacterium CG10_big_fil_rev_8_21_14_0_10_48_16 TaxID=1975038 RepID=A0A2M8LIF3_9BACT|nr:MAG: 50S ribosomal protein L9 [Candidatus Uhrbacteria bacterium CG10_big_fil_rev_8_21_14_0_10_48_16]
MKVLLMQDVKEVGKEGDIVDVSDGHARNFLFPQNMAVPATAESLKKKDDKEKALSKKEHREMSIAGDLASSLEGLELLMQEKVSEGGVLYASVSPKAIASALKKKGFNVDPEFLKLTHPLKDVGEHIVSVHLPYGFEAEIKIIIEEK